LSFYRDMSASTVKLLRAAVEIAGGAPALAQRLGISEKALGIFLADARELPDAVLLRAVDIILEDRESRGPFIGGAAAQYLPPEEPST
jgi:hypothetical protein